MTQEQITAIRQQSSVDFLNRIWELTAQVGMNEAANAAQARAELAEAQQRIAELEKAATPAGGADA